MANLIPFVAVVSISIVICLLCGRPTEATLGVSRHCTWHGTAPFCWPSCPLGKVSKLESRCGKSKIFCCLSGMKKLCCPAGLDISPALAAAIAH
ncbi:hypothetical protein BV898_01819 [Hypsibius exemplaris]|uniref:Uncharacterized protein n=1 Tax=Hypsibius exemplaris TaxID=2072580 RepID=A0A1W0XA42_HYPEX|nr:hypothetical protein BV898_01819 [Hypsibius exemplaris]